MEKDKLIEQAEERYPFLTGITYAGNEYVGIVVNHDNAICTFYDISKMPSLEIKKRFLDFGDMWWWESNRLLPINIFLNTKMKPFRYCLKTIAVKETEVTFGPVTSLNNLIKKRTKRKQIQLIRSI